MSQELHVAYPGYHAALCGLPRRAVHNLGRPQEGLHQSWTTCAKAKRHNQRLDLCGMLAQELMHINVVKGIKDTIGAKTFMGRASIPIRPFADRPGEPVTDWYDMGKGEWSNDDGTVGQPWHNSPGTLEGSRTQLGPPSRSVQVTLCLQALHLVSAALRRAPGLCAADGHSHQLCSLPETAAHRQTAELVPVTICSAQSNTGSSYILSARCVQVGREHGPADG